MLPYEVFLIDTRLPHDEIVRRLSENVEPPRVFRSPFAAPGKPYQGFVEGGRFKMSRIIRYRNAFLPVIVGTIGESRVKVVMRLHHVMFLIMVFWLGAAAFVAAAAWSEPPGEGFPWTRVWAAAILLFGFAICTLGFHYEARKSRDFLNGLLR